MNLLPILILAFFRLVPVLLTKMQYTEMDLVLLKGDADDAGAHLFIRIRLLSTIFCPDLHCMTKKFSSMSIK